MASFDVNGKIAAVQRNLGTDSAAEGLKVWLTVHTVSVLIVFVFVFEGHIARSTTISRFTLMIGENVFTQIRTNSIAYPANIALVGMFFAMNYHMPS